MHATDRQRLAAILGMLGSKHAGERAAAGLQAEAFRKKHGLTWAELLAIPPEPPPPEPFYPAPPPPQPFYTAPHSARPAPRATDWRGIGGTIAVYGYTVLAFCVLFGTGWLLR